MKAGVRLRHSRAATRCLTRTPCKLRTKGSPIPKKEMKMGILRVIENQIVKIAMDRDEFIKESNRRSECAKVMNGLPGFRSKSTVGAAKVTSVEINKDGGGTISLNGEFMTFTARGMAGTKAEGLACTLSSNTFFLKMPSTQGSAQPKSLRKNMRQLRQRKNSMGKLARFKAAKRSDHGRGGEQEVPGATSVPGGRDAGNSPTRERPQCQAQSGSE